MSLRSIKKTMQRIFEMKQGREQTRSSLAGTIGQCLVLVPAGVLASSLAFASPQGGTVVGGVGNIQYTSATQTIITQQSQRMAIDWSSFNLAAGDLVRFAQPSASASVLNRIFDQNPSQIFGTIEANGRVFLQNPNGLIFGEGSVVNVGSFVATTLNANVQDFMLNGSLRLGDATTSAGGAIINRGLIQAATGGSVTLVGGSVSNEGVIVATKGSVNLASGRTAVLDFDGDGLLSFAVSGDVLENAVGAKSAVANSGTITADGGQVLLSGRAARDVFSQVVNNEGIIQANSIDTSNGTIRLVGGDTGIVANSGTLRAKGDDVGEKGGTVQMLGEKVGLFDQGKIDVSGDAGGGTALVGGDFQGKNVAIRNASMTYVGKDASIDASALGNGDGGKVIVWADDSTRFYGSVAARGGAVGGNGGFVETSGKGFLDFRGMVDTSSPMGLTGTLLLDPVSIEITIGSGPDSHINASTTPPGPFTDTQSGGPTSVLSTATLNTQLAINNVTVSATDTIVVAAAAAIDLQAHGLTLTSTAGGITFGATTVAATGGGTLDLNFATTLDLTASPNFTAVSAVTANGGGAGTIAGTGRTYTLDNVTADAGSSGGITWTGVSNLTDSGAGIFNMGTGGSVTGTLTAGTGSNVNYGIYASPVTFALGGGASTGMGGWVGIKTVTGSAGSDTITGTAQTYTLNNSTANMGSNGTVSWTSIENLTDSGAGIFNMGTGGSVTGTLTAGTGSNVNYGIYASPVTFALGGGASTGMGGWVGIKTVTGSAGSDTITGTAQTYTLNNSTANMGSNGTVSWTSIENINDATGTVDFQTSGSVTGNVTANTLNYSTYAQNLTLDVTAYTITNNGVGGTLSGFSIVNANAAQNNTVVGTAQTYALTNGTPDGGISNSVTWTGFKNISDTTGTVNFGTSGSVTGNVTALTLNDSNYATDITATVTAANAGTVSNIGGTYSGVSTINAKGSNSNTMGGTSKTYALTNGTPDGGISNSVTWTGFKNISDTTGTVNFGTSGSVTGNVTANVLNYSTYGVPVAINQQTAKATGITGTFSNIGSIVGNGVTSIVGVDAGETFTISGANAGTAGSLAFSGVNSLTGGTGADSFVLSGGTLSGTINGGAGSDTLTGGNGGNTFTVTGANSGTVTGVTGGFSNIENLTGGSGNDSFVFANAGSLSGNVVGGTQTTADTLDLSAKVGAVTINQQTATATGINGTFSGIEAVVGNGASTTLTGLTAGETFTLTGANAGTAGSLAFTGVGNLVGGSGADTFTGNVGSSLSGTLTDSGGATTLNGVLTTNGFHLDDNTIVLHADMNAGAGDVYLKALHGDINNREPVKYTLTTLGNLSVITSDPLGKINLNLNVPGHIYLETNQTITLDGFYNQANIDNHYGVAIVNAAFNSILGSELKKEGNLNYYIDPALFNQQISLFSLATPELKMPEDQMEETLGQYDTQRWYKIAGMPW